MFKITNLSNKNNRDDNNDDDNDNNHSSKSMMFSMYDTDSEFKFKELQWRQALEKAYLITTVLEKIKFDKQIYKCDLEEELTKHILINMK
jgi:hypothetical protein